MEFHQDYKHNIIKNLHKAVKLCQSEFVNKNEVVTESNFIVSQLCKEWEVVFSHGIKRRSNKSIFSINLTEIPNNLINQIKPFPNNAVISYWGFICDFLESDDISRFTDTLDKVDTDIGRCRAWLRAAINEQTLEPFLVKVLSKHGQNVACKYYENFAILLDADESSVLPSLAAGISTIMFALEINNEIFNNFSETNSRSTSSSVSRPVLFSSSTSGSFEDIEIIEPTMKPISYDPSTRYNSRLRNRIINIVPIDGDNEDEDGVSDSSDLYSPFNLLKNSVLNTGLNLVSKFQFGNDEKLSNIQELENKTPPTVSNDPVLINGGFREFDESEFEDCRLSLQNEFYSPQSNELIDDNVGKLNLEINQNYLSADLLVAEPVVTNSVQSYISTVSPGLISNSLRQSVVTSSDKEIVDHNYIQESNEISNLKNQLSIQLQENDSLKNEFEERENQYKKEITKLNRENELLKKRLKTLLVENPKIEIDEFSGHSHKTEQLLQMHADILLLNDQLQRSIVDKDIKISMLQSKVSELMQNEETSGIHFDNFGTIYIGIVDYFQRGCGLQKHFCYKVNIRCCPSYGNGSVIQNDEWTTCRRYNEFRKFHLEFISKFPAKNIFFPSKWIYKPTEEQLDERQKGLELFLQTAITYIFQNFLNKTNGESHHKPVTYESFKRPGGRNCGSLDSGSNHNSSNFLDEAVSSNHSDLEKFNLSQQSVVNVIPFLAPSDDETIERN